MATVLHFTEDTEANQLLGSDSLALLIGMLLDQQIPMERAFLGPHLLAQRLGTSLDAGFIAAMTEEDLAEVFRRKPALHRFPANMAKRTRALCAYLVDNYNGHAGAVWTEASSAEDLYDRIIDLPGFGEGKTRTLVAILGKRLGVAPSGWEAHAPDHMCLADVESFEDVATYREFKRSQKK